MQNAIEVTTTLIGLSMHYWWFSNPNGPYVMIHSLNGRLLRLSTLHIHSHEELLLWGHDVDGDGNINGDNSDDYDHYHRYYLISHPRHNHPDIIAINGSKHCNIKMQPCRILILQYSRPFLFGVGFFVNDWICISIDLRMWLECVSLLMWQ